MQLTAIFVLALVICFVVGNHGYPSSRQADSWRSMFERQQPRRGFYNDDYGSADVDDYWGRQRRRGDVTFGQGRRGNSGGRSGRRGGSGGRQGGRRNSWRNDWDDSSSNSWGSRSNSWDNSRDSDDGYRGGGWF